MSKSKLLILFVVLVLALSSVACTFSGGLNALRGVAKEGGYVAGFFDGVVHGFLSIFTIFISFFDSRITMYEVNNSGGWYDLGFFLGLICFLICISEVTKDN